MICTPNVRYSWGISRILYQNSVNSEFVKGRPRHFRSSLFVLYVWFVFLSKKCKQLEEVNKQFNNIVEGVYNGLNANAMKDPSNGWKDVSAWIWNWGYYGEKSAYKEQQSILNMIKGYLGTRLNRVIS